MGFRYLFAEVHNDGSPDTILGELPLTNVSFDLKLNDSGTFTAELDLADPKVQTVTAAGGITLDTQRTAIYIDLNGSLVWGGMLWTVSYDSTKRTAQLGGSDFFSYLKHRLLTAQVLDASGGSLGSWTPNAVDQLTIVANLLSVSQAVTGGNLGLTWAGPSISGQLINAAGTDPSTSPLTYNGFEYKPLDQAITDLSGQALPYGFDFAVGVAYDGSGGVTRSFNVGYPRLGRVADSTGLMIDLSARSCLGYVWPEDGSGSANLLVGLGAGSGPDTLQQQIPNELEILISGNPQITAGYPLLEATFSLKDQTNVNVLADRTQAQYDQTKSPITLPVVTLNANADPVLGSFEIGDDCRVRCDEDPWFDAGYDGFWRITAINVAPATEGVDQMKLTLSIPPE